MKALVTGGGGFLGKSIVRRLLARGDHVLSFSRGDYPELRAMGAETVQGDLVNPQDIAQAARGCDIVFHVAALAEVVGRWQDFYDINVRGTAHVIEACKKNHIQRLVFTSSPSVVFNGKDQKGVDETTPYPSRYLSYYPRSKAIAEQMVLKAASDSELCTVALRPHLIWGPGDNHLVPQIIEKSKRGKLYLIGGGENLIDPVYIENAADAHILVSEHLEPALNCPLRGKAYFIGNDEPVSMKRIINAILESAGEPPVERSLPLWLAYAFGAANECLYRFGRNGKMPEMTRFVALQLARDHWFDLSAARQDFAYFPGVSFQEGMRRLKESMQADAKG